MSQKRGIFISILFSLSHRRISYILLERDSYSRFGIISIFEHQLLDLNIIKLESHGYFIRKLFPLHKQNYTSESPDIIYPFYTNLYIFGSPGTTG